MEKQRKTEIRKCEVCGTEFTCRTDSVRRFCNYKCACRTHMKIERHHICQMCGKDYIDNRIESKFCSRQCAGKAHITNMRTCPVCQKVFHAKRTKIIYCTPECSRIAHTQKEVVYCELCGKELLRTPTVIKKNKHHFCSKEHYDEWLIDHHEKKGVLVNNGIYHHGQGYIFRYQSSKNYKAEHRLVMEQCLGRPLRSDEIVHHKDGNKQNNDISNLEIVTRAEHIEIHRSELLEAREKARRRGKNV